MPSLAQVFVSVQWGWGGKVYRAPITALLGTGVGWSRCVSAPHHGLRGQSQRSYGKSVWELTSGPTPPPTRALMESGTQV